MSLFPEKFLFEELKSKGYELDIRKLQIPDYIIKNLKFDLFEWQKDALLNFLLFQEIKKAEEDKNPTHLLFNMATGTGKTLLMAALILYYYKQGKNKFIFFVNQNNIVGKTEDNLINPLHNKYLFQPNIVIDDKTVNIKKVDAFSNYDDAIQIVFTSIHALHNSVYKVKEDSLFLEQLQKDDIIMLGDEAHHLNAATKKQKGQLNIDLITQLSEKASQDQIEKSWEHTVIELILNKGKKTQTVLNQNALLEFTATVPNEETVKRKYASKIISKFDLKDFMAKGYAKEINLVSSSFNKRKRVLQALLFNWYRNEIALKYNVPNFKPVILFRSKYIDKDQENNSQDDFEFFINLVKDLTAEDFNFLNEFDESALFNVTDLYQKGQSRIMDIKRYMSENKLSTNHIIKYLQGAFVERNCIITNSKKGTKTIEKTEAETERLLNSLEDKNNHIRAIFTVQRLTEGWDVLNLYDIVRMYEGQNTGGSNKGKSGSATTSEVQLIGRGVRYYPFEFEDKEKNRRKFDNLLNHDLRVLEEFFFHSDNNEKYLSELKAELKRQELLPKQDKILKKYDLKDTFITDNAELYKKMQFYKNNKLANPNKRKSSLEDVKTSFAFEYKIDAFTINETTLKLEEKEDITRFKQGTSDSKTLKLQLKDFEKHIIWKAINRLAKKEYSIFRFDKLKEELKINSLNEILENQLLGEFPIRLIVPKTISNLEDISNLEQLNALIRFFEKVAFEIESISNPYIGSDFELKSFAPKKDSWYKEKSIFEEPENIALEKELKEKDWYIYNGFSGTSEERNLISFLKDTMGNFENKYEKVFLLRNEEVYKIYDFEKGRGFQPDFLLFLKSPKKELYYQVFIEPKGGDRISNEDSAWKELFLKQISHKYGAKKILKAENKEYVLFGLPLYNQKNDLEFKEAVNENLEVSI